MMMGENFISYFNKVSGTRNKYFVETNDDINVIRLKKATGIEQIYPVEMNSLFKEGATKYDFIYGYLKLKKITAAVLNEIDLVVVLGGDDFTEDYGWKGPIINAIKFNILKREGSKILMLGQTMGPFRSLRKPIMKNLLSKIDKIYLRDPISYAYLKDIGLKNISIMDDLALLPLSKQEIRERTKEYITYFPSELIYRYAKAGGRQEWIDFNLFMIAEIMEKYQDKKVVLLAHVLQPEHVNDRIIVEELYRLLDERYKDRIIIENKEMYPYQVRNYIQQSLFVVSSRMHPVVSSIQCEIPAIVLAYSSKYWGIIGERYGLGDFILDVRYRSYNEIKEKAVFLMDKIEEEYEQIQEKMSHKNKLVKENTIKILAEIANSTND